MEVDEALARQLDLLVSLEHPVIGEYVRMKPLVALFQRRACPEVLRCLGRTPTACSGDWVTPTERSPTCARVEYLEADVCPAVPGSQSQDRNERPSWRPASTGARSGGAGRPCWPGIWALR